MKLQPISQEEDKTNPLFASEDCQQLLNIYESYYPQTGYVVPWIGYFVINENRVVGSCGFVSQPNNGQVEIAYWTFKANEGQGIASFACRELVKLARQTDPDVVIVAKTAPMHNASTRILEKNNFTHTGIVQDHEIGDAWLWTLPQIIFFNDNNYGESERM